MSVSSPLLVQGTSVYGPVKRDAMRHIWRPSFHVETGPKSICGLRYHHRRKRIVLPYIEQGTSHARQGFPFCCSGTIFSSIKRFSRLQLKSLALWPLYFKTLAAAVSESFECRPVNKLADGVSSTFTSRLK